MSEVPDYINGIPVIHAVPPAPGLAIVAYQPLFAHRPVVLDRSVSAMLDQLPLELPLMEVKDCGAGQLLDEVQEKNRRMAGYLEGLRRGGPATLLHAEVRDCQFYDWAASQHFQLAEWARSGGEFAATICAGHLFLPRGKTLFTGAREIIVATYLWLCEETKDPENVANFFGDLIVWEGMDDGEDSPAWLLRRYLPQLLADSGKDYVPERLAWTIVRCFNQWADPDDRAEKAQMMHTGRIADVRPWRGRA